MPHGVAQQPPQRLYQAHLGARLNLTTLPIDSSRYRQWWLDTYGAEALAIACAFVADCPASILPSRPAGSSELVGSRSKSRRPNLIPDVIPLELEVASNHSDRRK